MSKLVFLNIDLIQIERYVCCAFEYKWLLTFDVSKQNIYVLVFCTQRANFYFSYTLYILRYINFNVHMVKSNGFLYYVFQCSVDYEIVQI